MALAHLVNYASSLERESRTSAAYDCSESFTSNLKPISNHLDLLSFSTLSTDTLSSCSLYLYTRRLLSHGNITEAKGRLRKARMRLSATTSLPFNQTPLRRPALLTKTNTPSTLTPSLSDSARATGQAQRGVQASLMQAQMTSRFGSSRKAFKARK
jgi:outer membrane translocation and assembly module TamA